MSRVPETTSSAPQPAYTVSSLGVVVFGFRTSIRKTAGTGRFALFAIAAVTRKMSPGATESGTPSTVNVTAKPFTCTSFDTVLLRVGVRMPTALAANKTTKDRRPRPQFDAVSSHRSHLVRLTEAGSDGPPGLAGITRPRACIVHV